jgi:hypothetical protein
MTENLTQRPARNASRSDAGAAQRLKTEDGATADGRRFTQIRFSVPVTVLTKATILAYRVFRLFVMNDPKGYAT